MIQLPVVGVLVVTERPILGGRVPVPSSVNCPRVFPCTFSPPFLFSVPLVTACWLSNRGIVCAWLETALQSFSLLIAAEGMAGEYSRDVGDASVDTGVELALPIPKHRYNVDFQIDAPWKEPLPVDAESPTHAHRRNELGSASSP